MGDIVISNLAELGNDEVRQATGIFVEGFYDMLRFFSTDPVKLAKALEHALVKEQIFVAMEGEKVLGIFAYSVGQKRPFRFNLTVLRHTLGWIKGGLFYHFVRQELGKPLGLADRQCYFEAVATAKEARGRGVASLLNNELISRLGYEDYILEVVDTNIAAIRLYEKLGYVEFRRKPQRWFRKQSGFNARIYMRWMPNKDHLGG
ncbi:GNAT family N-acetyltransferase [Paenibacillus timonensis]|uniref:GNAT family N-acetyltransferase n=1 Tax=Paenibacillus timonensis TaxID=225915 RepID=UPI003F99BC0B